MNYLDFQKSISNELIATKDRVRLIVDNHWGEEGKYKEVILMEVLKKRLPKNVCVGTGFIVNQDQISTQIDIIVYRNEIPIILQQGDFVIVPSDAVLGVIEVKTSLKRDEIAEIIDKAAMVNSLFSDRKIFNGIFAFDNNVNWNREGRLDVVKDALSDCRGLVNYICFGQNYFAKYWDANQPFSENDYPHYSFYRIENLSFGYFISNLIEDIYCMTENKHLPQTMSKMFYPIENTKEAHRFDDCIFPPLE